MALAARMQISDQDVRTVSSVQGGELLGQTASTSDGRIFTYAKNGTGGGTALAVGKLAQGAVSTANHINRTGVTAAAGSDNVTFAVGNTAVSVDQYLQGYLVVNAGTGAGQALLIRGNTKAAGNGSPTIYLKDQIITATLVSDSKFSLFPHKNSAAIIADHTAPTAAVPVGVPCVSIPDANWGWFQVGGTASVLANGTPGLGFGLIPSATTDGAFDVEGTSSVQPRLGFMLITAVTTEYRPAFLTIPV